MTESASPRLSWGARFQSHRRLGGRRQVPGADVNWKSRPGALVAERLDCLKN